MTLEPFNQGSSVEVEKLIQAIHGINASEPRYFKITAKEY